MKTRMLALVTFGLLATLASSAKANFVVNGGFTTPAQNGYFVTVAAGQNTITGWNVVAGTNGSTPTASVDVLGGNFLTPPVAGTQTVDLDGTGSNPVGGVTQTLSGLVVGGVYTLDFFYSNNPGGTSSSALVTVGSFSTTITHSGATSSALNYSELTATFTATSTSQLLSFISTDAAGDQNGIILGGVSVNVAVPEPASCAMLGLGILAVGAYARRRLA